MGVLGGDVGAMRMFAGQLRTRAQLIEGILTRLDPIVRELPWVGSDRDRFVEDWQHVHRTSLVRIVLDLRDASGSVDRHADDQERASRSQGSQPW